MEVAVKYDIWETFVVSGVSWDMTVGQITGLWATRRSFNKKL